MVLALKRFSYRFDAGPLSKEDLDKENFQEGNCRRAIQYYLYKIHQLFIEPGRVLNPQAYCELGEFIIDEGAWRAGSFEQLKEGDIVYAERIHKEPKHFLDRDAWMTSLHSAIYLGNRSVYHATSIEGKSCEWSVEKFLTFYNPIAVKRLV